MPLRPLVDELLHVELLRRLDALERKVEQLEQAIAVDAGGKVTITASLVEVQAAMAQFSGVVRCDTIIANSVVGSSYTPGAGNVM